MTHLKSVFILSAAATLLSATPALAQYGSGSGGARTGSPVSTLPSTPSRSQSTRTASKAVSERSIKRQQEALSKRDELERKIARQEAQAKSYGSGTKDVKDAATDTAKDKAQDVKDQAYGSGTDKAEKVKDKAYGSGDEGAKDAADKAYGSGDDGAEKAADKAYGSGDKAADKAYGSGTDAAHDAKHKAYGSGDKPAADGTYNSGTADPAISAPSLPVNCPAGTKAQPNGTCLLVDSSLLGL